jgi:hypothetical protein
LFKAFPQKQIHAFIDDKLKRGNDISHSLYEAIEGSFISLIIFSENYASSRWCLEELVKIIECKEKYGQIVIPVFYEVDPTDVRHQKKSYENALVGHEKKYILSRVKKWRQALEKSANLSGIKSLDFRLVFSSNFQYFLVAIYLLVSYIDNRSACRHKLICLNRKKP